MTEENKIKRYYIIFHFRTHNSAYKGSTYTVYGRGGDKHYAKLCEEGEQPHLYNSAKTAEKSAKNLISFCENVSEHYSIKEIEVENTKENGNFYIVFFYADNSHPEIYGGGYYRYKGDKYAQLADSKDNAKIFKTRTAAINKAEWLLTECSNTGVKYSIVDINESNTDIYTLQARAEEGMRLNTKREISSISDITAESRQKVNREEAQDELEKVLEQKKAKEKEEEIAALLNITETADNNAPLTVCPHCGSSVGFYTKHTEKEYYTIGGDYLFSTDDCFCGLENCNTGLFCSACDKFIIKQKDYQRIYQVFLRHFYQ